MIATLLRAELVTGRSAKEREVLLKSESEASGNEREATQFGPAELQPP